MATALLLLAFIIHVYAKREFERTKSESTIPLLIARFVRTNPALKFLYRKCFGELVPLGFAALLLLASIAILNRIVFDTLSAHGLFCTKSKSTQVVNTEYGQKGLPFSINEICSPTGIEVEKGQRYRITLQRSGQWFNKTVRADLGGHPSSVNILYVLLSPLKRWWGEDWLKPIIRIGTRGNDEYLVEPFDPLPPNSTEVTLIIRARRSGELFVYVNDAVMVMPWITQHFYDDNRGSGSIKVERVNTIPQ